MTARRALSENEVFETDSASIIPDGRAVRGFTSDDVVPVAARRRLTDDTTTIRPVLRELSSPVAATEARARRAAPPRRRRVGAIAALAAGTALAAIVSLAFVVPQSGDAATLPDAAAPARNLTSLIGVSGLSDAADAAADALAADAQVKAAAAEAAAAELQKQRDEESAAAIAAAKGGSGVSRVDYAESSSAGTPVAVADGEFIWPVTDFAVTSPFGQRTHPVYGKPEFHTGIDLAKSCGSPIVAAGAGVVTVAGRSGGLGNYTEISSGSLSTGYGHQSRIVVKVGQQVKQGDVIGYVGSTGVSTGCHVHFQVINAQGKFFDPATIIH